MQVRPPSRNQGPSKSGLIMRQADASSGRRQIRFDFISKMTRFSECHPNRARPIRMPLGWCRNKAALSPRPIPRQRLWLGSTSGGPVSVRQTGGIMNHVTRLLTAVTAVLFLALGAASPALASSLPRIQTYGMGGSWHDGGWRIRPHLVAFGAHFLIKKLSYRHYNQRDAYGHGRLVVDNCRPNCVVGGYWVRASGYFFWTGS